jgi:hypothetical protein
MSKSSLLLSSCTAWAGPLARWYDESLTEHRERTEGTEFHEAIASELDIDGSKTIPVRVQKRVLHASKYLQEVLLPSCESLQAEVPVGINWLTGEAELVTRKFGEHRNYPNKPGWQYGTTDLVGIRKDGRLLVADWKTGSTDGAKEQLLSLACALSKCMPPVKPVTISCLFVNDEGVWPHEEDITHAELQSHADAMRFVWEDVLEGKTHGPNPGVHCTASYCPHLGHCPAITSTVLGFAEKAPEGLPELFNIHHKEASTMTVDAPKTDQEAGLIQALVSAANRQIKYLTEANKRRIGQGQKVTFGQYVWEERGNGFRWYKN